MRNKLLMAGVGLILMGTNAYANGLGEDRPWQFKDANTTASQAINLDLMERKKAGYYDGTGQGAGGGGGFGGGSSATNNFYQFVDQSTTVNNCTSNGVGSPITCGGATNNSTNAQTTTQSNATADTTVTGNSIGTINNGQ